MGTHQTKEGKKREELYALKKEDSTPHFDKRISAGEYIQKLVSIYLASSASAFLSHCGTIVCEHIPNSVHTSKISNPNKHFTYSSPTISKTRISLISLQVVQRLPHLI